EGSDSETRFYVEEDVNGNYVRINDIYKAKADLTNAELEACSGEFYSIKAYDAYIKVLNASGDYYVALNNATKAEKAVAESADGNYVYYLKAEGDTYTAIAEADMLVANASKYARKPFASVMIYLWDYELGLNIGFPEISVESFDYIPADENTPEGDRYYFNADKGAYVRADGTEPAGTAYYQRATVENVISRPTHNMNVVESNGERNYVWNWETEEFVLESALEDGAVKTLYSTTDIVRLTAEETELYTYDDWTRSYMPVSEYLATYFTARDWTDANRVNTTIAKYNSLALYEQDAEEIQYVDSDDMFFISMTIRGGISITGYYDYMSVEDYLSLINVGGGNKTASDIDPSLRYRLEQGAYVQDNTGDYVLYSTGVEESLGAVLGGIVGDLDEAMIRVLEGFTGEMLFEVKINISYRIDWKPEIVLNIFDIDLAMDVWRRENDGADYADGTLTHMIGIYYNHDIDTGDAALYIDLSWMLGEGGRFAIDMSAYSIEALIAGILSGELTLGGGEAMAATEDNLVDSTANPALAGVFVNIYTRKVSLAITKGFIEILLQLLGVDLGELLPNFNAQFNVTLAPYTTGLNINLFNEDGTKGVLTMGLELQLFNGTENSSAIDFGTMEDFNSRIEDYKGNVATNGDVADNHVFYYGNFVQNENASYDEAYIKIGNAIGELKANGEVIPEDAVDVGNGVYNTDRKYYVKATEIYSEAEFANAVASGILVYTRSDARLAQVNNDSVFNVVISREHYIDMLNCWNITEAEYIDSNIIVSGTMEFVEPARRYNIVDGVAVVAENPAEFTHIEISPKASSIFSRYISVYRDYPVITKYYVPAWDKDESGALYVYTGAGEAPKYADLESGDFQEVTYDANGVITARDTTKAYYKVVDDFTDYNTIMSVDLSALLSGGDLDIMALLGDLETVELDMSMSVDLKLSDVINWTEQMSSFLSTELYNYFEFILASTDWDNGNFGANIGLVVDMKAFVNVQNILDYAINGGELIDAIKGLELYLNVTCTTNYFNEDATIEIWMNVDGDGKLNLYMNLEELNNVVGLGEFFSKVKFEGLDLAPLLDSVMSEAEASADTVVGLDTLGIESGDSSTGIIPEDIFGIVEMVLGQVLFGHDIIAIGLKETILVDLVGTLAENFNGAEYLPKLEITEGADTSGLVINLGGGAPSIGVNLGFVVGYESYAELGEYAYDGVKFSFNGEEYVVDSNGTHIMVSSDKYALIEYANSAWTGDRYSLNADGTTFTKTFSEFAVAEVGYTGQRYALRNGQYIADENGNLKKNANTFSFNADGKGAFVQLTASDLAVARVERYAAFGSDGNRYLPVNTYEKLSGIKVEASRNTYDVVTAGDYLLIGDLSLNMNVYDFGIYTNNDSLKASQTVEGEYLDVDGKKIVDYADITKSTLNLTMAMDISYFGLQTEDPQDAMDLSEIISLVFGLVSPSTDMSDSSFRLNVTNDMGSDEHASMKIVLGAYIDLNNFGATEIALEVFQYSKSGDIIETPLIAIYLANDNVYIDASTILGETGKLYLGELGLGAMLDEILGGILNTGDSEGEAMTASGTVADRLSLHDWAFLKAMIHPQYFSLTMSMATINAIVAKIYEEQGKEVGNLIPNLGDFMIETYGYAPVNGVDERPYIASFSIKMSDGFYLSADVTELEVGMRKKEGFGTTALYRVYDSTNALHKELGGQYAELTAEERVSYEGARYTKNGDTFVEDTDGLYKYVGERYNKIDAHYANAPEGFDGQRYALVDGNYVTADEGQYMFVEEHYERDANGDYIIPYTEVYNVTTGEIGVETISMTLDLNMLISSAGLKKGSAGYTDTFASWVENLIISFVKEIDLLKKTEFLITLPTRELVIDVKVQADINVPALLVKGIAGILYSDFAIEISADAIRPDTNLIALYYLGSTTLKKTDNVYDFVASTDDTNKIFADSLYIDATGLGLGFINFHGLAGIINPMNTDPNSGSAGMDLEGMIGGMIASESEASSSSEGEATASASTSGINIQLDIEDGNVVFKADKSLIDTLI
ncbi:MAG: hypothetical protein J6U74_00360, partial [Clostridia bacterium]|nr:hypothetical protein [Clostridia bacterium]